MPKGPCASGFAEPQFPCGSGPSGTEYGALQNSQPGTAFGAVAESNGKVGQEERQGVSHEAKSQKHADSDKQRSVLRLSNLSLTDIRGGHSSTHIVALVCDNN
jgi:hypothetical protein